jgi:ketosteroid isomerase-like protein
MATRSGLFADDAVWHVPGSGSLSGDKRGRDAILAFFGELFTRSGGTVKITLRDVIGGDEHTIGLHHEFAHSGSNTVDQNAVNIFHIRGGQVSEVWELHEDPASNAWLWA